MVEDALNETLSEISTLNDDNPWPGLYAYRENDHKFFHGRRSEIENILRLVMRGRLTVLFGLSGLGKTSLLNAGLFPHLRKKNIIPVYIRLDYSSNHPNLVKQVKQAIETTGAAFGVEVPKERDKETLWEYFHAKDADFWNERNRLILPLLVFDQFEEIFTLGKSNSTRADSSDKFLVELGNLIEGRPPSDLKEFFDAHPDKAGRFNFNRHHYNILLSLREDFLPELEGVSKLIPSITLNRMRLHRMNGNAAFRVVSHAKHLIKPDIAEKVVRFVAAEENTDLALQKLELDPALLSVVCRELNNKRRELDQQYITADLFRGSQEEILSEFYKDSLSDLSTEVRKFVEENLLTDPGNRRDSIALDRALKIPGVDRETIDLLVKRRLIRKEERVGLQRLELTHDLLIGVITDSRDRRRKLEKEEERKHQIKKMEDEIEKERRRAEDQTRLRKDAEIEKLNALIERKKVEIEKINTIAEKNKADKAREIALRAKRFAFTGFAAMIVVAVLAIVAFFWALNAKKDEKKALASANKMVSVATSHRLALQASEHLQLTPKNSRVSALMARLAFNFARQTDDREAFKQSAKVLAKAVATFDSAESKGLLNDPDDNQNMTYKNIALSSDGKLLAASGWETIIILERKPDGSIRRRRAFPLDHTFQVASLSFSPDDELLATVMADKTIILWKVKERGNSLWKKHKHTSSINSVAFDRDGNRLALGSTDKTVQLWNFRTEQFENFPDKLKHPASFLRFHPDQKILGIGCEDGTVYLWNIETNEIKTLSSADINTPVKALVFSTDRKFELLAAGYKNRNKTRIVLWSIKNPSKYTVLKINEEVIFPLAIKNKVLFSGIHGWSIGGINEKSLGKQELKMQLTGDIFPGDQIISSAYSADGFVIAALSAESDLNVWHTRRLIQADGICSEVNDFTKGQIKEHNLDAFDQKVLDEFSCRKMMSKSAKDEEALKIFYGARDVLFGPRKGSKKALYLNAIDLFKEAKKLNPKLQPEIERELENWHEEKVKDAIDLAHEGKINSAVKAYNDLEKIDKDKISAAEWNELCRSGINSEKYKEIKSACEKAVEIDPNYEGYKINRGIYRAATARNKGDLTKAIEDLKTGRKSIKDEEVYFKKQVKGWIDELSNIEDSLDKGKSIDRKMQDEIRQVFSPKKL